MRNSFQAVGLGALVAVSLGAYAADPFDIKPESRAYLHFDFGGTTEKKSEFHYGLQLGQRAEFNRDGQLLRPSSSVKLDYSNIGNSLLLNGKPLVGRKYQLNQNDVEPVAPAEQAAVTAEEPGFFGKIGNFFVGLWPFGGDEAAATDVAAADTAAAAEPGWFDNYSIADYALLGVGVVGVGYAISQVAQSDDSGDPSPPSGGGTGGGTPPPLGGLGGVPTGGVPPLPTGGGGEPTIGCTTEVDPSLPEVCAYTGRNSVAKSNLRRDPAYAEWLDGGSGQMGDLIAQ